VKFSTLLVDSPWPYHHIGRSVGRAGFGDSYDGAPNKPLPYSTMSIAEIAALPIAELAADDAHLYCWTTNGYLEDAFAIVRAWRFEYSTALVWAKNAMGGGLGASFGITTEFLLFARRGRLQQRNRLTGTWFNWKRRYEDGHPKHSAKPHECYSLIEHVSPGPYVELFSREKQPRIGWSYWGNESLGTASLEVAP